MTPESLQAIVDRQRLIDETRGARERQHREEVDKLQALKAEMGERKTEAEALRSDATALEEQDRRYHALKVVRGEIPQDADRELVARITDLRRHAQLCELAVSQLELEVRAQNNVVSQLADRF